MSEDIKKEIIQRAATVDLCPAPIEQAEIEEYKSQSIKLEDLSSLGVGFETVKNALASVTSGKASAVYKVTIPSGGHLAEAKDGGGFLGTVLKNSDNKIMAQARLQEVSGLACDPTMLFMSAALMSIEMKLNEIQDTQIEILDLLVQKEKAKLRGSITFLTEAVSNYKFNWDNEQYKNANYQKALDIRQQSEQSILLAQNQINKELAKKDLINTDQSVEKKIEKLKSNMEDYQLALYLLGLSYYAEILLQGNFDSQYLRSISEKIDQYSIDYRIIYSKVYDTLAKSKGSAIQGMLLKGLGKAGKGIGDAMGQVPLLKKGPIDEVLKKAGNGISTQRDKDETKDLAKLLPQKNCNVKPFVDTLDMINRLYNEPVELAFDQNNLYVLDNSHEEAV